MSYTLESFVLDTDGVKNNILLADWMGTYMESVANGYLSSLPEGYEVTQQAGKYRWRTSIAAVEDSAKTACYNDNELLKAVYG